jgi:protein involved in polysaccharide export with SLBB domain
LFARQGPNPGEFELFQRPPPALSEFERFVSDSVGQPLERFGSSLILNRSIGFAVSPTTTVPPDYRLNPGDELDIGLTGAINGDLRLVIDTEGRVFIPHVGPVNLAGVRYGDLTAAIRRQIGERYRDVSVSAVIGHLHGITVYVTGYAVSPGSYTVSSLSTIVDAVLTAGGPAAGGSFRNIQLRRNGQLVTTLDLYNLLLNGDKSHDAVLQNNDVLNIEPVGPELAVVGSVNASAIFEAKPGETLQDIVRYAGGFNSLADTSRLVISSLADLDRGGSRQISWQDGQSLPAERGDIVRELSLARIARPQERQAVLATIEGEVDHPGRYFLPPGSKLDDLLARAGGMTGGAFVYGTVVSRESIKVEQQASFARALQNLELTAAAQPLQASILSGGIAGATARSQGALQIINRLRDQTPSGRLILNVAPAATTLPANLVLENNDRIFIPPMPKVVGVFGSVFNSGSYLYVPGERLGDYLKLAGGPQKYGDKDDIFVVRANGSVVSVRQVHSLLRSEALPGDVVFVPIKTSVPLLDKVVTLLSVLSPLATTGLGLAALGL